MATEISTGAGEMRNYFFSHDVPKLVERLSLLDRKIGNRSANYDSTFDELYHALGEARDACRMLEQSLQSDYDLLLNTQIRYRDVIAPWFDKSWFMYRAKTKPCGYPGDFEILRAIYGREPKSKGLGGYLDLYFLSTALGRAVPSRLQSARAFLDEQLASSHGDKKIAILNVACGPCHEFTQPCEHPRGSKVHVTCIDNEPLALDYVSQHIVPLYAESATDFELVRYNALRLRSADLNRHRFGMQDIIYSVGLCDYIPDRLLIPMVRGLRQLLSKNGALYIAFKDCRRYESTDYHWLVDWHFLPRVEADCWNIFEQAGFERGNVAMTRDETGVIMNFVGRVETGTQYRHDVRHSRRDSRRNTSRQVSRRNNPESQ